MCTASLRQSFAPAESSRDEVVHKAVFDRKIRLVGCVGIEGSGHHFVRGAMETMSSDGSSAKRLPGDLWNDATLAMALTLDGRNLIKEDFKASHPSKATSSEC